MNSNRRFRLPPLPVLVAFETAGRLASFTRAADELGVSPSAISQHVKALETDLGTALFRRHGRGVELTEDGRGGGHDLEIRDGEPEREARYGQPLFRDVLVPVCSPTFRETLPDTELATLAAARLIHLQAAVAWTDWRAWFDALGCGLPLTRGTRVDNVTIAVQTARDGNGLLLGWRALVAPLIARGLLVTEPTNIRKVIRCPYHSWCNGLDGRLEATPHVGGPGHDGHVAIRREERGLVRVPSATYLGVVFVNVSGTTPPFETSASDLLAGWADVDRPLHAGGQQSRFTLELRCNWKLAVENCCDGYHPPSIHPGLNSYSRLEDHYPIEQPDRFSGQGTCVYRQPRDDDGTALPDIEGAAARWSEAAGYVALCPFSPAIDGPPHAFHRWVVGRVRAPRARAPQA